MPDAQLLMSRRARRPVHEELSSDIPDGEAQGTAIVAPGTTYSVRSRRSSTTSPAEQDLRRLKGS
jgi:hypothetical protein